MRKKPKFLISAIIFTIIASSSLPYLTSLFPSFSGYTPDFLGGLYIPQIPSNIYDIFKNPIDDEIPTLNSLAGELDRYEGTANTLAVTQYADIDSSDNSFSITSSTAAASRTVGMYLDTTHNWEGTYLSISISDLMDQRMWISNPGLGSSTSWGTNEIDNGDANNMYATFGVTWYSQSALELRMDDRWVGFVTQTSYFDTGDTIEAYQTVSITRGTVRNAWISFDYGVPSGNLNTNDQGLAISIDGTRVWYKGYAAIRGEGADTWHNTGLVPIPTSSMH